MESTSQVAVETPATQDQLWALKYLLACDWSEGVEMRSSFTTEIVRSVDDTEQRWAMVRSPYRTLSASLLARAVQTNDGANQIANLRNLMMRSGTARWLVPVYCDEGVLTSNSSGSTLTFVTTNKRYFPGGQIAVVVFDTERRNVTTLSVFTISTVSDTGVVCTAAVGSGFLSGRAFVFPLMEAELKLENDAEIITDSIVRFSLEATEVISNAALDNSQAIGSLPSGMSSFDDLPILNVNPNLGDKLQIGTIRSGDYTAMGRGKSLQVFGTRPRWKFSLSFLEDTRAECFDLLRIFESRGGRCRPLWLTSPLNDIRLVTIGSTSMTVQGAGLALLDWSHYTHICIVQTSGSIVIRKIVSVTRGGTTDTVNYAALTIVPTLAQVSRIGTAHKVRFDTDEITEEWITDGVMSTSLELIEVVGENSSTGGDGTDSGGPNGGEVTVPVSDLSGDELPLPELKLYMGPTNLTAGGPETRQSHTSYFPPTNLQWEQVGIPPAERVIGARGDKVFGLKKYGVPDLSVFHGYNGTDSFAYTMITNPRPTPSGRLYAVFSDDTQASGSGTLYRFGYSDNGGTRWQFPALSAFPLPATIITGKPATHRFAKGAPYLLGTKLIWMGCIRPTHLTLDTHEQYVYTSNDDGETWTAFLMVSGVAAILVRLIQSVFADVNGILYGATTTGALRQSADGGLTWSAKAGSIPSTSIGQSRNFYLMNMGRIIVCDDSYGSSGAYYSDDLFLTTVNIGSVFAAGGGRLIKLSGDQLVALYAGTSGADHFLILKFSGDRGVTWSNFMELSIAPQRSTTVSSLSFCRTNQLMQ